MRMTSPTAPCAPPGLSRRSCEPPGLSRRSCSRIRGLALGLGGLALLVGLPAGDGAEVPGALAAEKVRDLQTKYQAERAAADSQGLARKFSPACYQRADALAKQGAAALAANRLLEARDLFCQARWNLPAPPLGLPDHVARLCGDGRFRHAA